MLKKVIPIMLVAALAVAVDGGLTDEIYDPWHYSVWDYLTLGACVAILLAIFAPGAAAKEQGANDMDAARAKK